MTYNAVSHKYDVRLIHVNIWENMPNMVSKEYVSNVKPNHVY